MPLDPRLQQALSIAPGQQFSPWKGLAQPAGAPADAAQPMAPEDQSTEASRAEAAAQTQANIQRNEAAKKAEQDAMIADLKSRAAVDPKARRQLQLILESQ